MAVMELSMLRRRASLFGAAMPAGIVCAVALVAAVVALAQATSTDLSPITPPGSWKDIFFFGAAVAFVSYAIGVWSSRSRPAPLGAVLAVVFVVQIAPLATPLLLSRDVYAYEGYGRIATVDAGNPYRDAPSRFRRDSIYSQIGSNWRDRITIYGPVTTAVSAAIEDGNPSTRTASLVFRLVAALSVVACVALAVIAVPPDRRGFAAAFIGWNPLLALHFAGGGHNDAFAVALALGAVVLSRRDRPAAAGVAAATAVLAKAAVGVLIPVAFAQTFRRRAPALVAGLAAAAIAIAVGATIAWGHWWISSTWQLHGQGQTASSLSAAYWLHRLGMPLLPAARLVVAVFIVAYAGLIWTAWRGRPRVGLTMVLLVATTAWLMPWYAIWAVPFAAIEDDALAQVLAVALSGYFLQDAIPTSL